MNSDLTMVSDEKFTWKSKYSVQIPLFDAHHKKLVGMLNDLLIAMKNRTGDDLIEEILSRMTAYSEYHFKAEEKYMEKYHYPSRHKHIQAHQEFIEEIHKFEIQLEENKFLMSVTVYRYLKDWLTTHIAGMDKEYTAFFKKHHVDLLKPDQHADKEPEEISEKDLKHGIILKLD